MDRGTARLASIINRLEVICATFSGQVKLIGAAHHCRQCKTCVVGLFLAQVKARE